jgi:hypothetical protein
VGVSQRRNLGARVRQNWIQGGTALFQTPAAQQQQRPLSSIEIRAGSAASTEQSHTYIIPLSSFVLFFALCFVERKDQ